MNLYEVFIVNLGHYSVFKKSEKDKYKILKLVNFLTSISYFSIVRTYLSSFWQLGNINPSITYVFRHG